MAKSRSLNVKLYSKSKVKYRQQKMRPKTCSPPQVLKSPLGEWLGLTTLLLARRGGKEELRG